MHRRRRLLAALTLLGCAACSSGSSDRTLTVLAASSLTGVLDPLGSDFSRAHPGVHVRVSYAGSPTLLAQVRAGAPADVVITASAASLAPLVTDHVVQAPTVIATNAVVLITP